ncbi:hypothetical protein [Luteipulveratus mongoliensis]|uniref:Lipoprotein n=1 Tax=Luteipulveratus mongoliensis TaxID=571913 RepID=A0A0K1JI57_9MICO|nr:hypothetical protein [Luteipulveratus mongoliensis]AKU16263.1 hypothetical protein VV02_10960 [Luteipulveratus mongoliensis]
MNDFTRRSVVCVLYGVVASAALTGCSDQSPTVQGAEKAGKKFVEALNAKNDDALAKLSMGTGEVRPAPQADLRATMATYGGAGLSTRDVSVTAETRGHGSLQLQWKGKIVTWPMTWVDSESRWYVVIVKAS